MFVRTTEVNTEKLQSIEDLVDLLKEFSYNSNKVKANLYFLREIFNTKNGFEKKQKIYSFYYFVNWVYCFLKGKDFYAMTPQEQRDVLIDIKKFTELVEGAFYGLSSQEIEKRYLTK